MTFEDLIDAMNAGNRRGPGQWTPGACAVWRKATPQDARLLEALVAWELSTGRRAQPSDEDERGISTVDTLSGNQEMVIINESGLYSLILTSRKPAAKRFKKWVTAEVLPTIRKTGSYRTAPAAPAVDPMEALLDPATMRNLLLAMEEKAT
jgi:prophage antirepressor-like protein